MTTDTTVMLRHAEHVHSTFGAYAKCRWPHARFLGGIGEYALISSCTPEMTVSLHETRRQAMTAKHQLAQLGGCSTRCSRNHKVVRMLSRQS